MSAIWKNLYPSWDKTAIRMMDSSLWAHNILSTLKILVIHLIKQRSHWTFPLRYDGSEHWIKFQIISITCLGFKFYSAWIHWICVLPATTLLDLGYANEAGKANWKTFLYWNIALKFQESKEIFTKISSFCKKLGKCWYSKELFPDGYSRFDKFLQKVRR